MFGVNKSKIFHIETLIEEKLKHNSNYFFKQKFPRIFIIIILIVPIILTGIIYFLFNNIDYFEWELFPMLKKILKLMNYLFNNTDFSKLELFLTPKIKNYLFNNIDFFKTWISIVLVTTNLSLLWVYWYYSKYLKSKLKLGKNDIVDFFDDRVQINNRINNLYKEHIDKNFIIESKNIDNLLKELEDKRKSIDKKININISLITSVLSILVSQYIKTNEKSEWIDLIPFIILIYFLGYFILKILIWLKEHFLKDFIRVQFEELIEIENYLMVEKKFLN
jgi:hypothetical protein